MIASDRLGLSAMEHLICLGLLYIGFTNSSIVLEAEGNGTFDMSRLIIHRVH